MILDKEVPSFVIRHNICVEVKRVFGFLIEPFSSVINGRAAVSAEMAIRFAAALGGSAESWLRMQAAYDLWQASKKRRPKIVPLKLAA